MNQSLKNPCLECDHHLTGGDKNCDRCRECEKRVEYVNAIGKCPSSTMSEHVDLQGDGGVDLKQTIKNDPIEKYIQDMCKANGISVETLRSGLNRFSSPHEKQTINDVRDDIIRVLASGKFGYITQPVIGEALSLSPSYVSMRMRRMNISLASRERKAKPKTSKTREIVQKKQPEKKDKTLVLCFDDHPELYNDIIKLADKELREPENQAIYILLKVHERGLNLEKTGQNPQP